jgi:hypothetical protein
MKILFLSVLMTAIWLAAHFGAPKPVAQRRAQPTRR